MRIELFGDEIERITVVDPLTGERVAALDELVGLPGHPLRRRRRAHADGHRPHRGRAAGAAGRVREGGQAARGPAAAHAHPVRPRDDAGGRASATASRTTRAPIDGRGPGEPPNTLLDFFPDDFLVVIDESHVPSPSSTGSTRATAPARQTLIEHGFRLPSAADNRPLRFEEFMQPGRPGRASCRPRRRPWELEHSAPGGRADRAAHRPGRSRGHRQADQGPDRRPHRADQRSGSPTGATGCWSPP